MAAATVDPTPATMAGSALDGVAPVASAGGASPTAADGAAIDGGMGTDPVPASNGALFPPVADLSQAGPYTSETITGTGPAGGYTVYRPTELAPGGALNPIVGWMSGGGTTHDLYALLPHLATHGFVVIAADVIPGIGAEAMLGEQIIAGIDWLIAEHSRQGSDYEGRLDVSKTASAGYSMGSLATFMIADDPRLTTTVHISGGNMVTERVQNLRSPAAFICGTPDINCGNILSADCDIAAANCDTDFEAATVPVFYANFASGHLGILTPPFTERITTVTTAWLRYHLMADTTLRAWFVGDDCKLCSDANWQVRQKQLDMLP